MLRPFLPHIEHFSEDPSVNELKDISCPSLRISPHSEHLQPFQLCWHVGALDGDELGCGVTGVTDVLEPPPNSFFPEAHIVFTFPCCRSLPEKAGRKTFLCCVSVVGQLSKIFVV